MKSLNLKDLLTLGIASLGFLLSLIVAINVWKHNHKSQQITLRQQYMSSALELDKMLIQNPSLWAILDDEAAKLKIDSTDVNERLIRKAGIYYMVNLMENIYYSYHNGLSKDDDDTKFWNNWDLFMKNMFSKSTEMRILFNTEMKGMYHADFVKYICSFECMLK